MARPRQGLAQLSRVFGRRDRVEIGAGWLNVGQVCGQDHVGLNLAHPDIGARAYKVKLGRAAGQDDDDVSALIWNAED